jgi:ribosomal protein S18 acetylase RimI-like enzyme
VDEHPSPQLVELRGPDRELAIPALLDSFVGIYRWHAKRTLREVSVVRAAMVGDEVAGVAMLETLTASVGYVYYLAVRASARRQGIGGRLLDDGIRRFAAQGMRVVYAAAEEENLESIRLFGSRGFRAVERQEPGYQDGGLGAWGLRKRMWIVSGEVLLGLRLAPEPSVGSVAEPGP